MLRLAIFCSFIPQNITKSQIVIVPVFLFLFLCPRQWTGGHFLVPPPVWLLALLLRQSPGRVPNGETPGRRGEVHLRAGQFTSRRHRLFRL